MAVRRDVDRLGRVHWRDPKTGQFAKKPVKLWRFTAGINDAVCKGEYLSVTYQEWHLDPLSGWEGFKVRAREHINEELRAAWGSCYHSRWEDWNGPPYFSRQFLPRPDDLDWRGDLMGYFTSRGEPGFWVPTGGARFGEARKRRMARKMIKGGKWFKPETLLKWLKKGVKV